MKIRPYIAPLMTPLLAIAILAGSTPASAGWFDQLKETVQETVGETDVSSAAQSVSGAAGISTEDMSAAFKEALEIGSKKVVDQLGKAGGFENDSAIRIPLPEQMQTVKKWLGKVGLDGQMDELETKLNRAAEDAVPQARSLFVSTIKSMSFEDVKSIYNGGNDAATRFFQEKMTPSLSKAMAPKVEQSLAEVGAVKVYDDVISDYKDIPFVPDVKADLVTHVVDGGLGGIFHYLAKEEAAIRENPVKRTTELLQRVFGQ